MSVLFEAAYDGGRAPVAARKQWHSSVLLRSLLVDCELVDLGDAVDSSLGGIFSPANEVGKIPLGVTSQFLGNPQDYHHFAEDTDHAAWLIKNAIGYIDDLPKNPLILDVGSGSGNTAFAMLKAVDNPTIVASDISSKLLQALVSYAAKHPNGSSVVPVCIDLNKPWFRDEKFDLVLGRAILHHLFDPDILVSNLYRSIKLGGSLIFFEPYECGYDLFGLLIELIIETSNRLPGLQPSVREFLERTNLDCQKCEPKPIEVYANIDDKWNFTRRYFERIADRLGASLRIYPLYESPAPLSGELRFRLKAGLGAEKEALPNWAWDLVGRWEKRISRDALDEMACAVGVIFTKCSSGDSASHLSRLSAVDKSA